MSIWNDYFLPGRHWAQDQSDCLQWPHTPPLCCTDSWVVHWGNSQWDVFNNNYLHMIPSNIKKKKRCLNFIDPFLIELWKWIVVPRWEYIKQWRGRSSLSSSVQVQPSHPAVSSISRWQNILLFVFIPCRSAGRPHRVPLRWRCSVGSSRPSSGQPWRDNIRIIIPPESKSWRFGDRQETSIWHHCDAP